MTTNNPSETARNRAVRPSTLESLRLIQQQIDEALSLLKAQQDWLRQQGMNLPPGTLNTLQSARQLFHAAQSTLVTRQAELRQLQALSETSAALNSSLNTVDVLNQVMDTAIRLTGAERGYIVLRDADREDLIFHVARGLDQQQLRQDEFTVSRTIVRDVAVSGNAVLTDNALNDPNYAERHSIHIKNLRSILAVPLKLRGVVTGVVYCDSKVANMFKESDLKLLNAFADQAAAAIENARLYEAARARLTEAIEVRDLMNNIFTSIASGVVTTDAGGTITACNAAAARILALAPERVVGLPLFDVLPQLGDGFTVTLEAVRSAQEQQHYEAEFYRDGGGTRIWSFVISPLHSDDSGGTGVAIVLDDLTETRRRESQLAEARRYLPSALVDNLREIDIAGMVGQECEISAIFADVRGFTSFSEKLAPEQLLETINRYMTAASDSIDRSEGIVDKYMGDAVTGLFNTPLNPQHDHALRAVTAALALQGQVSGLHADLPEDHRLFFGVGVHTGSAVLGNIGGADRKEFSAMGSALDLSKTLQESALPGQVLISEQTYILVADKVMSEPVTVTRRGVSPAELGQIYLVTGLRG